MNACHDYNRLPLGGNRRVVISLVALALQTILLFLAAREERPRLLILGIAAVVALAQIAATWFQSHPWRSIDMAMGMTLVGGLGMALGGLIDSRGSVPLCAFCQANSFLTWSNGLMLVFCFAGCRLLFRRTKNFGIADVCVDCLCMISMTVGMFLSQFLLMPMCRHSGDDSAVTHWVMLLGMFFGNVGGLGISTILSSGFLPVRRNFTFRKRPTSVTANNSY